MKSKYVVTRNLSCCQFFDLQSNFEQILLLMNILYKIIYSKTTMDIKGSKNI